MKFIFVAFAFTLLATLSLAQGTDVSYRDGATKLKGYFVKASQSPRGAPGVVVIHAWMGLNDFVKNSTDQLGALGYNAFAADIYGEQIKPKTAEEAGKASGSIKGNRALYRTRILAAIDQLVKAGADPNRIAVIGYCFGGTGAIEAARANMPVKGIVSFHGGLDRDPKLLTEQIKPKLLILHGADDPFVPEAQVKAFQQEMRASKADWQMIYYANSVHAFTEPEAGNDNSKGAAYNELAAKRSWEHMKLFFRDVFGE
jgi:dienelactone hydrolase